MGTVDPQILLLAGGAALVVLILGLAVAGGGDGRGRRRAQRISQRLGKTTVDIDKAPVSVRRPVGQASRFEQLASRLLPRPALIRERLSRTGRSISLGRYLLINAVVGVIVGAATWKLAGTPSIALAVGLAGGILLPHLWVGMATSGRLQRFVSQFPDALDLIVRGLKSGLPITDSIKVVGDELPDPLAGEFRAVAGELAVGRSLDDALWMTARKLRLAEFDFFVVALSVQRETGGNLAETLENLSDILRRRHQTKLKIKALSAEAKASAYIIGSLPFVMFALIGSMNPGYLSPLIEDPRGQVMLGIGLGWLSIGAFIMAKMVRFEI